MKLPTSEINVDLPTSEGVVDLTDWPQDNVVQPFMIDATGLNGRYIRLGSSIDEILSRHALPEAASILLGEFLALAAGLAAALKYDGVFTLQTKGDGPIPLMVADVTSEGDIRGYAQLRDNDPAQIPDWEDVKSAPVPKLLGSGYVAFTVDFSTSTERYQGIVSLDGATLSEVIRHYFEQSAQFTAATRLACGQDADGHWRASSLIIQHLPEEGGTGGVALDEDGWQRATTLLASATVEECIDPDLPPHDLLYRLFNEDGVRVFEPRVLQKGCRCSDDKMLGVLATLTEDDLQHVLKDGKVEMVCEFCNVKKQFSLDQIRVSQSQDSNGDQP